MAAINRRGNGVVGLGTALVPRLRRVLAGRVPLAELLAAVERANNASQPPMVVAELEAVAAGSADVDLESRLAAIDRLVATFEADGGDPPESLLAERARWQTELNEREGLHRDHRPAQEREPLAAP